MKHKQAIISTIAILLCYSLGLLGQQETIMTKYTFNSMFFNPAYAGSHGEGVGTATVQYRNQWLGVEGAPTTMLASGEVSLYDNSLGIGATLGRETIGVDATNEVAISTAYRIRVGREGYMSGGLRTSFFNVNSNFSELNISDPSDGVHADDLRQVNYLGVGFGLYYHDESMYLGVSVPTIATIGVQDRALNRMHHIFFNAGLVIGDDYSTIKWQPSILVKYQPAVPLQMTISTMAWLKETFAVGLHWRYADALALSAELHFMENWKISTAYDLTISDLSDYSSGSPEVMLGYRFGLNGRGTTNRPQNWYY